MQGVGFRWWTRSRALELGLTGWATNLDDGRVEVVAEGTNAALPSACWRRCASGRTPGHVTSVTERWSDAKADCRVRGAVTGS